VEGFEGVMDACSRAALLAAGLHLEPLAHPKPGAVTRLAGHGDKDVFSFAAHASLVTPVLVEACRAAAEGGCSGRPLLRGLSLYRRLVAPRLRGNVAFGSFMLLLPLAAAAARPPGGVGEHAREASRVAVECSGVEEARLYLEILASLKPSHLGSYHGPLPDALSPGGASVDFAGLLRGARWDLVHREILEGYPRTLEAVSAIRGGLARGSSFEEALLHAILWGLARWGDTLIYQKYGGRAYLRAVAEAERALAIAESRGVREAMEWLDSLWRPRGWNPGAVLDVAAAAVGLLAFHDGIYDYIF